MALGVTFGLLWIAACAGGLAVLVGILGQSLVSWDSAESGGGIDAPAPRGAVTGGCGGRCKAICLIPRRS